MNAPRTLDDRAVRLFIVLAAVFCANAVLAEFIGVKIFALEDTLGIAPLEWNLFGQTGSLSFTAGTLLWPFVFVLTDDLSTDLVRFMPNVRRMMREGTRFTRYYVASSACCPSRATIFTGLLPHNSHVFTNVYPRGGIYAFAVHGDLDLEGTFSNTFELEWPKGSGKIREFPEIDRVGWFSVAAARLKLLTGQRPLLDQLLAALEGDAPAGSR